MKPDIPTSGFLLGPTETYSVDSLTHGLKIAPLKLSIDFLSLFLLGGGVFILVILIDYTNSQDSLFGRILMLFSGLASVACSYVTYNKRHVHLIFKRGGLEIDYFDRFFHPEKIIIDSSGLITAQEYLGPIDGNYNDVTFLLYTGKNVLIQSHDQIYFDQLINQIQNEGFKIRIRHQREKG